MLRLLAFSLAVSSLICHAEERAVVIDFYSTNAFVGGQRAEFCPGEIVRIVQSENSSSLVKRDNGDLGSSLVPNRILIKENSFKPIHRWGGEKHPDALAGDYSVEFSLLSNGTFHTQYWDEEVGKLSPKVKGQLYRSKNILWARSVRVGEIRQDDLFVIQKDQSLCWGVFSQFCNCNP